jgi:hypothetical protein
MADKVEKPKKAKAKPKKDEKGVLAALPSTRPERIGTRRTATAPRKPAAAKTSSAAKTSAAKTSAAATTARAKPSSRPTAARRKAAAPRTFEPTGAAEAAAGTADPASLRSSPRPAGAGARAAGVTTEPRPRAVREGAPGIGTTSPDRTEAEAAETGRPSGVELVTTAVQAAGELAQIGLTVGGQILKRAAGRIRRP